MLPSLLLPPTSTDAIVVTLNASESTASAIVLLESELRAAAEEAAVAAGVPIDPNASLEPYVPAQFQRVLGMLRVNGFPLSMVPNDGPVQVSGTALAVFDAFLDENGLKLLAEEKSVVVKAIRDVDAETMTVEATQTTDGTLLFALASVLEDADVVGYEFETQLPNAKYRQLHLDPEKSVDADPDTFWNVVSLGQFNRVATSRRLRGFEEHLLAQFPHPFTLEIAPDIPLSEFRRQARPAREFIILDENAPGYNPARVNAPVTTASRWPRLRPELIAPEFNDTLVGVCRTRLRHYKNCLLLFHGTLRNSAVSIDQSIDFRASQPGSALGRGFYASSNFNEARAYALARLRTKRRTDAAGGAGGAGSGAGSSSAHASQQPQQQQLADNDIATVIAFFVKDAHEIVREMAGWMGRGFVVNHRPQMGNQVVLHEGCKSRLTVVQVHDIDARGRIYHTGIADTAHLGSEKRGVETAVV